MAEPLPMVRPGDNLPDHVPRYEHEQALQMVTEQAITDISDHLAFGMFGSVMQYVSDHPEMASAIIDKFLGIYLGTLGEMHGGEKCADHAMKFGETVQMFADGETPAEAKRLAAMSIEAMEAIMGAYQDGDDADEYEKAQAWAG